MLLIWVLSTYVLFSRQMFIKHMRFTFCTFASFGALSMSNMENGYRNKIIIVVVVVVVVVVIIISIIVVVVVIIILTIIITIIMIIIIIIIIIIIDVILLSETERRWCAVVW